MKKIFVLLLAALLLLISACGRQENTPATGQKETNAGTEAYDPSKTVEFEMKTSETNRIVTVGTVDKSLYSAPILITSFGQSTDAATLDTAMKRAGANYDYTPQATADEIGSYKTLVIAVGASTKGLGQAGISEKDETARAEAIMAKAKETGAQVDIQEDGTIFIGSSDSGAEEARARIEAIVKVPEVGEEYFGRVVGCW